MKKFIFALTVVFAAAPSHAWVFLDGVERDRSSWLLPKLLSGRPVRVCIDVMDRTRDPQTRRYNVFLYGGENRRAYYEQAALITQAAYQSWFDNLRSAVDACGRKKEFQDLLVRLPKTVSFLFVNLGPSAGSELYKPCESYPVEALDLRVRAALWQSGTGGHAAQTRRAFFSFWFKPDYTGLPSDEPKVRVNNSGSSLYVAQHEAGHTLGLGDLYEGDDNAHNSRVYTLAGFYRGETIPSVMNREQKLTCDDADGLANLLDFFLADEKSSRRQTGWVGFCPGRRLAYARALALQLTEAEEAAQAAFVSGGYKGRAPLADKIQAAWEGAASARRAEEERASARENAKRALADSLSAVSARTRPVQEYKPHVCVICGKPIDEDTFIRLPYPKKGVTAYAHKSCNTARKAAGRSISPANLAKYGEKTR